METPANEQQLDFNLEVVNLPQIPALWTVRDIYENANGRVLRMLNEDRRLERKAVAFNPRELGDYLSMWSNTGPDGGLVVIGIDNSGAIAGCRTASSDTINALEDCWRVYCPDARIESKRVSVENNKGFLDFVILFLVHYRKDKVVRHVSGKAFRRSGDKKHELRDEEIRELQIEKGEVQFELEPVSLIFPQDFNNDLVEKFCANVRVLKGLELHHESKDILAQQRLGTLERGRLIPNNACCLLLAKEPHLHFPGCKIRIMRFDGEFEGSGVDYNLVKDIVIEGPLPILISQAEQHISAQLRDFSALGSDGRFYSVPEYPKVAWYEGIVNACCHRSYGLRNMTIFIKIFDDKMLIVSPGALPPMVTPENIYETHNPRNPFLMEAMRYFDFVKCANEGTRRMRDAMSENRLPAPAFNHSLSGNVNVTVKLQNNHKQRRRYIDSDVARDVVSEEAFGKLSEEEKRIINYVVEYETVKVSQAARHLSRDWGTAKKILERLTSLNILTRLCRQDIARDPKAVYVLRIQT
ncbi:MAG TPA: ATP-binding protein [Rariglobus sp.]|jgi:ATP-dependent DNA helicase RecG|nr:ATP-binding protein [Rariglobus sp.]